jgi:hypothetical protein
MPGLRKPHPYWESGLLKLKGLIGSRSFGVHWFVILIFKLVGFKTPKCVLPNAYTLVSIKQNVLCLFMICLHWNDQNIMFLRALKSRKYLLNFLFICFCSLMNRTGNPSNHKEAQVHPQGSGTKNIWLWIFSDAFVETTVVGTFLIWFTLS